MRPSAAFASLALVGTLALSGCGSNEDSSAPASSAGHHSTSSGATSKPVSDRWLDVYPNDDNDVTKWRCAGTTLLIRSDGGYDGAVGGLTSLANDHRCGGNRQ